MAEKDRYPRVSRFKTAGDFRARLSELNLEIPCDDEIQTAPQSPLAQPLSLPSGRGSSNHTIGNRFAIQPMEGWDGTVEGGPSDLTRRRWVNFGRSGAKLIWGGEAFAVCPEGRANPNQLMATLECRDGMAELRELLLAAHADSFGTTDDLVVGLQLTHSGRFCRPHGARLEPGILYHHPILDHKFGIADDYPTLSDDYLEHLVQLYVEGAAIAAELGYDFVDVKHCHGYLGHELLGAQRRPGAFGGSFENRTRFCREIITGIRQRAPGLMVGVRFSAFDFVPFRPDPETADGKRLGPGIPESYEDLLPYEFGFGMDASNPVSPDLREAAGFIAMLGELGVDLINITAGSPYYNPHIQRPALFPPSDGYQPPEDPLVGVARQLRVVAELKRQFPRALFVGSGLSYLQEYLPHVAQACVRQGWLDFAGLGRMVLSYPELPRDVLERGSMERKLICRTFSDCTTAPRNGLVSGCFPLDSHYKGLPAADRLKELKAK